MTKQNIHTRPHQVWSFTPVVRTQDIHTFEYFWGFCIFPRIQNNTTLENCVVNRNVDIAKFQIGHIYVKPRKQWENMNVLKINSMFHERSHFFEISSLKDSFQKGRVPCGQ